MTIPAFPCCSHAASFAWLGKGKIPKALPVTVWGRTEAGSCLGVVG